MDRYTIHSKIEQLVSESAASGIFLTLFITEEISDGTFEVDMKANHDNKDVFFGIAEGIMVRIESNDFPNDDRADERPDPLAN